MDIKGLLQITTSLIYKKGTYLVYWNRSHLKERVDEGESGKRETDKP